tara:strand:- start:9719 stop:10534 length:816 start_codon:yes stop_codon:yes gene_type:complete
MILLIPAGWSLWLTPSSPPPLELIGLLIAGGIFISGAGCIANDLWDKRIDREVSRTKNRPLAIGTVKTSSAVFLLGLMLILSLSVVLSLPQSSQSLCLRLAITALPLILIYPSAKRWFPYPQAILSICWGFASLIPWAASESNINGGVPMFSCWVATMIWTFGFDTVYAMADTQDDANLGLNSSALSFKGKVILPVSLCYAITSILLAFAAFNAEINLVFWPILSIATIGMQREVWLLRNKNNLIFKFGNHFKNQVWLGSLILFGLVLGRM